MNSVAVNVDESVEGEVVHHDGEPQAGQHIDEEEHEEVCTIISHSICSGQFNEGNENGGMLFQYCRNMEKAINFAGRSQYVQKPSIHSTPC